MVKHSMNAKKAHSNLQQALDRMLKVLKNLNDSLHVVGLKGFPVGGMWVWQWMGPDSHVVSLEGFLVGGMWVWQWMGPDSLHVVGLKRVSLYIYVWVWQ